MGKAIENHAYGQDGPQRHRELSQFLSRFSMEVAATVHKHYGALVYAGGDDIMALLPLDRALICTRELAKEFEASLQKFTYMEKDAQGKEKEKHPTLSAGIAVIHHVSLLDEALALARQAEHHAKDQAQKNSLAIIIRKRSGEDYPLVVSWSAEKVNSDAQPEPLVMSYEHLHDLIALSAQDALPKGTAYELRDMVQRLQPAKGDRQSETLQRIIQIDAARILRRKLMLSDANNKKETEATLVKVLQFIGVKKGEKGAFQIEHDVDIHQFINALIVAQTFAEPLEEQKEKEVPGE
jgi:CRISPR-associated protein Cmr2